MHHLVANPEKPETGSVPDSIDLTENDPELEAALEEGSIPDSPLARQVFANWKRYPESIVLTRVGKFYEVSPRPASAEVSTHSCSCTKVFIVIFCTSHPPVFAAFTQISLQEV